VVHTPGLPDDLAPGTKLAMFGGRTNALTDFSHSDLRARFEQFKMDMKKERHVSLDELLDLLDAEYPERRLVFYWVH